MYQNDVEFENSILELGKISASSSSGKAQTRIEICSSSRAENQFDCELC